jgi:uncharacterized protein (TIGR00255 family)
MTGFARVRKTAAEGEIILSIKSVNHRGLDMHFHMPPEFDPFETAVRTAIKSGVTRGHLQIHVSFARATAAETSALNRPLFSAWLSAFREAAREYELQGTPDINAALRIPGMLGGGEEEVESAMEAVLLEASGEALAILNAFRAREGATIAAEMRERCATLGELVGRIAEIRETASPAFHKRLRERLADLLKGAGIDPQRLAQEAALLADRSDISEEIVRLKTHAEQVSKMLAGSGEVGKRLDFLLQEMNREANTILSKTGGIGDMGLTITELALQAKAEIEKIREQSLNLE